MTFLKKAGETANNPETPSNINQASVTPSTDGDLSKFQQSRRAIDSYRQLAQRNPKEYLPKLARILDEHADELDESGKTQEALNLYLEASAIWKMLATDSPSEHLPSLARSCNNLGGLLLFDEEQYPQAEDYFRKAIDIYEKRVKQKTERHNSSLRASYRNLARLLEKTNRHKEASSIRQRVQIMERESSRQKQQVS